MLLRANCSSLSSRVLKRLFALKFRESLKFRKRSNRAPSLSFLSRESYFYFYHFSFREQIVRINRRVTGFVRGFFSSSPFFFFFSFLSFSRINPKRRLRKALEEEKNVQLEWAITEITRLPTQGWCEFFASVISVTCHRG